MSASLIELMTVRPVESADVFSGESEAYGPMGIYGGHLVGQALSAGFQTVDEPKLAHSFHCYFLRPGNPEQPVRYEVTRLREGRGSDVRTITAFQHGHAMFQMMASLKLPEDGDSHQPAMPQVESPEDLLAREENRPFSPPPTKEGRAEMLFATDHFMQPEFKPGREAVLQIWHRCTSDASLSDREQQLALAFISDGTLMFNAVLPHGLPFQTHRLTTIDHAGWFHGLSDVRDWMLFDQHSSTAADGRGMNHGTLFDRNGRVLMTLAQESLLRRV